MIDVADESNPSNVLQIEDEEDSEYEEKSESLSQHLSEYRDLQQDIDFSNATFRQVKTKTRQKPSNMPGCIDQIKCLMNMGIPMKEEKKDISSLRTIVL